MKQRWLDVKPGADEKQAKCLNEWAKGERIKFESSEAEERFCEKTGNIRDAIELNKPPKRIPFAPSMGYFPLEYAGVSPYEAMYEPEKAIMAAEKFYKDFEVDVFVGVGGLSGSVLEILDLKMYQWPGHGVSKDREFQYVEGEYMRADEYPDLIDDPTGWFLTKYFPRVFGSLKGLELLPVIPSINEIVLINGLVLPFALPDMQAAVESLLDAGQKAMAWNKQLSAYSRSIMAKGYPAMGGGFAKAPFDVIGDTLRGTQAIMMDMFRHPEDVIEACERLVPIMIKTAVAAANRSRSPFISMPLHKGADGFMSEEQFLTFYWPSFRKVLIGIIDEGLVPCPFAEGSYNTRLDIISDLPKGKTVWMFDQTDMKKAKGTIGKKACIKGNVPSDLMCTGTPDEVTAYCKALIEVAGEDGGYIFSTGAGLQGAKVENVRAMFAAVKRFAG